MVGPHISKEPQVIGKRHSILDGFQETDIIPYGGLLYNLRLDAGAEVPMTYIPQFPTYPPETAYMREPKTDIPGVILRSNIKGGRVAFVPADIDRQFGHLNLPISVNFSPGRVENGSAIYTCIICLPSGISATVTVLAILLKNRLSIFIFNKQLSEE
jgi:hypothetical protein